MTSMNDNLREEPVTGGPQEAPTSLSQSPIDQPLDAVVVGPGAATAYAPLPARQEPAMGLAALFTYHAPAPAQYMVPRRFGMSAILGIMTALAILFGCFRMLNAEPVVYLFFGMQTLVICFAQMLNSRTPRLASSIAGAVLAPIFVLPLFFLRNLSMEDFERVIFAGISLLLLVPLGAFLGYLTGTCAAGIFLVMDYLEPYLQGQGKTSRSASV
jgi:hypothetical protein